MGIKIADMTERDHVWTMKGRAAEVLRKKAFGIGENHEEPGGRQLALDLLDPMQNSEKLVKHLFIEIPESWGQIRMAEAAGLADGPESLQIRTRDVEAKLEALFAAAQVTKRKTLIPVVSTALLAGVYVYCADLNPSTYPSQIIKRNELIAKNVEAAVEIAAIAESVKAIAQKVKAVAKTDFSGCLLLFGSDHFDGKESETFGNTLCDLIPQMDWVKF